MIVIEEILSISAVQDAITILPGTPPFLSIGNRGPSCDGAYNQPEYYRAINASSAKNDCGIFVDFMLNEILNALKQHISGTSIGTGNPVLDFIINHLGCRANQISESLGIPLRTLQRELSRLKVSGKIEFRGAPKNGGYFVK